MFRRSDLLLSLAAFLLALGASVLVADGRPVLGPDGAGALHVSQNIAAGEGLVTKLADDKAPSQKPQPLVTKPPLFPVTLAFLIKLGVEPKSAGWAMAHVSFAAAAGFLYLLARLALPVLPAILVTLMFSIQISGLKWSITVHEEWLFIALTFGALLTFIQLRQLDFPPKWGWLLLGAIAAAAPLASYPGIAVVLTIGVILLAEAIRNPSRLPRLLLYSAGVAITSVLPLIRFISLSADGIKPAFYKSAESTWFTITAGVVSTFQSDFVGWLLVWLYSPTLLHKLMLVGSLVLLGALLLAGAKQKPLMPVALYVVFYLVILVVQLAGNGVPSLEPRYAVPVEGLILLLATAALWPLLKHRQQIIRFGSTIAVIAITGVFVAGQVHRLRELSGAQSGMALSREYCPSPQTFAWVRAHIPPGSTIMSTQCGYQLIAETNDYYWLRIPPADEYASSPKFLERWGEQDFLRVSRLTGAKWIVIPLGEKGDPLAENPGYGPFVARLLQGQDSLERIKRMASFADGRVYLIQ